VVALNLGTFTIVAFNGLVVWWQLTNVQRDWGEGWSIIEVACREFAGTFLTLPAIALRD